MPYKGLFWATLLFTVSVSFISTYRPYLVQHIIDTYIASKNVNQIYVFSGLLLGLLLLTTLFQLFSGYMGALLGQLIIRDLRNQVFKHLLSLQLRFFDKTPVGTLVTRSISDIETITEVFSEGFINILGDLLQVVFILTFMFYQDWRLSLVSLSVLPFLILAGYWFKERVRISFEEVRNRVSELNTFVQEHISGMQIVQLFNREDAEFRKFKAINKEHRDANIRGVFYYSVFFPVVEIISSIAIGLVVWYGAHRTLQGASSAGTVIAFIMYIGMFFRPVRQIADRFNTLQMGVVASKRIFALTDDTGLKEESGSHKAEKLKGELQFDNVSLAYETGGNYVLRDVSFFMKPGKTIALVGATGAGKSSVINLLGKFYSYSRGHIFIDGIELKDWDTLTLRSHMAVVLQDVFLFSGTILDNITLYDTSITEEQVVETAKQLGAHDFISRLPQGYRQMVQERGLNLSTGQRQLISFVRAMVRNPALLVLDEATSSIDHETEEIIQRAIAKMMKGRTSIVIAHRLSTIQDADEILVLDKGSIVERGTQIELLERNGLYRSLYEKQFVTVD